MKAKFSERVLDALDAVKDENDRLKIKIGGLEEETHRWSQALTDEKKRTNWERRRNLEARVILEKSLRDAHGAVKWRDACIAAIKALE